jgi:uncharacterized protein (DUF1330 family)
MPWPTCARSRWASRSWSTWNGSTPTLAPFGGRFIVHGGDVEVLEGSWPGALIVIEFPDRAQVRAWYDSQAYREIVALRTANSQSDVIVAEGVGAGHRATDVLTAST